MKNVLTVEIKNYKITITDEDLAELKSALAEITSGQKCFFVVSKRVYKLYSEVLDLENENVFILNDGEKEKNFKNYVKILEKMSEIGLTRKDAVIALGGGVVGDIAGFAASTYMRGIDYIQIPTTLLSMVDSSVGGKTAIDMGYRKNVVGTFYQPKAVLININFLKTLNKREFLSGLGEVLKYAIIEENCAYKQSLFLFEYLTLCAEKLLEMEPITLMRVIEYCLNLKISVVNQDEKESGLRKVLNFGHTLGHAIEALGKYRKFTHGEAVVQGIFFMLDWAYKEELITYSYYRLSLDLLSKYAFKPIKIKYSADEIVEVMKKDKKADSDKITFIIPCDKKRVKELSLSPEEAKLKYLTISAKN